MNEVTTSIAMVLIFCIIGVLLPVVLMIKDKNGQSALPNKLILWITMVFCMTLVFGIVVDFSGLSETIRADVIQFGFIAIMLFGAIFGIDQLLKSRYIKTVKWKDLTVETDRNSTSKFGKALEKILAESGTTGPETGTETGAETGAASFTEGNRNVE